MNKLEIAVAAQYLSAAYKAVAKRLLAKRPFGCTKIMAVPLYSQAPSTLGEMLDCIADRNGTLLIAEEGCSDSVYGRTGNLWFRAMHDLGHLAYGQDTTTEDELALAVQLAELIAKHLPPEMHDNCAQVYYADTVGQSLYCELRGHFPKDQQAFVRTIVQCRIPTALDAEEGWPRMRAAVQGVILAEDMTQAALPDVPAALPAEIAQDAGATSCTVEDLRAFAAATLAHNRALRRVAETRRNLLLAANRFMRAARYPYGKEKVTGV